MYIFLDIIDNGLVSTIKVPSIILQFTKMGTMLRKKDAFWSYPQLSLHGDKKEYYIEYFSINYHP